MRLAAVMIAAAFALPACSLAEPARQVQVEVGKSFDLKVGGSARTVDAALQIGFEAVTGDSRCPKGEQCVRAGDATVRIWLQQGSGPRQTRELHAAPGPGQALRLQDLELRLLRLDPYPVTGRPIATADYVASFTLNRGSASDAER
jgi:hypothetical protein